MAETFNMIEVEVFTCIVVCGVIVSFTVPCVTTFLLCIHAGMLSVTRRVYFSR